MAYICFIHLNYWNLFQTFKQCLHICTFKLFWKCRFGRKGGGHSATKSWDSVTAILDKSDGYIMQPLKLTIVPKVYLISLLGVLVPWKDLVQPKSGSSFLPGYIWVLSFSITHVVRFCSTNFTLMFTIFCSGFCSLATNVVCTAMWFSFLNISSFFYCTTVPEKKS